MTVPAGLYQIKREPTDWECSGDAATWPQHRDQLLHCIHPRRALLVRLLTADDPGPYGDKR